MSEPAALLHEAQLAFRDGGVAEAEVLCRRLLRRHPTDAGALHLLGLVHAARGDDAEAVRLLAQSLAYSQDNSEAWCDLASACHNCGLQAEAIRHLTRVISMHADCYRAYGLLATIYYRLGLHREAADLYRDWFRRYPTDAEVHHMLLATTGEDPLGRCSETFVRVHFDNGADVFEERLIKHLGYRGHEIVSNALVRHLSTSARVSRVILDAGCGTGLCGPIVRPCCSRLIGVDLSQKMLDRARARNVYDELILGELCAFMDSRASAFDAIVSSDVLIYFGDLHQFMLGSCRALRPEGVLAVTMEASSDSSSQPYRLERNGRYSHGREYVMNVVSGSGLELLDVRQETIRYELGKEVPGLIVVALKRPDLL